MNQLYGTDNLEKKNVFIGCTYNHPSMNQDELNKYDIKTLLKKLDEENKIVFILGDFNINSLDYEIYSPTNEFVDNLS